VQTAHDTPDLSALSKELIFFFFSVSNESSVFPEEAKEDH